MYASASYFYYYYFENPRKVTSVSARLDGFIRYFKEIQYFFNNV